MDKLAICFFAEILYIKKIIGIDELEAILDIKTPSDLDEFIERLITDGFDLNKRGESYIGYGK